MNTTTTKLKNGVTLLLTPMKEAKSTTLFVTVPHGSRHETKEQAGLAHFFEHMVFKGGKKYPTPEAISQTLDSIGADYNAFTDFQQTAYYARVAAQHFDVALDVISDYLQFAQLRQSDIDRERGVILEEYNMYWDMPDARADMQFPQLIFGDTPLGRPIIGVKERIKAFKKKDFSDWYAKKYSAEKVVISIAGAIPKDIEKTITQKFAHLPTGQTVPMEGVELLTTGPKIVMDERPGEQIRLILGFEAKSSLDDDIWVQLVMRNIMGSSMSSRLFSEIREKRGLCYSISMQNQAFTDVGLIAVESGLDSSRIEEAVTAIWAELKKITKTAPTDEEISRAKEFIKSTTILGLESTSAVARYKASQHLFEGGVTPLEERFKRIDAVSKQQVKDISAELFQPSKMGLVMVGPKQDVKAIGQIFNT